MPRKVRQMKKVAALYAKSVRWSDEDQAFVGTVHALAGDCCHGDDPVKVYRECESIALECVEATIRLNRELPRPEKASSPKLVPSASAVRSLFGMSQREFADFLNISAKTLHKWEQGTSQPSGAARTLLTIAATNPRLVIKSMGRAGTSTRTAKKTARRDSKAKSTGPSSITG